MTKREAIRVAAAGDIHCSEENREQVAAAFDEIQAEADLVFLAGDLTTLPMASPVRAWMACETANAANTMVRCASMASRTRGLKIVKAK